MKLSSFAIVIAAVAFLAANALFVVGEREQALVFQFGEFKAAHTSPGLKAKLPFIQNVVRYPSQVLLTEPPAQEVILADQKRLVVDAYAYMRISDPLKFFQNLFSIERASDSLNDRINSNMREILGKYSLLDVLSEQRAAIMTQIQQSMNEEIATLGVQLVDVRIGRAELPTETRDAVYRRMQAERIQEARQFRAEGGEQAQKLRAKADKERTILLAEANKIAQKLRGEGDGQAIKIYANAFNKDPSFYAFYRSLEAYKTSLADKDTKLILSPDNQFFKYFQGR